MRNNNRQVCFELVVGGRPSVSLTMERASLQSAEQVALLAAFMNILQTTQNAAITVARKGHPDIVATHEQMINGTAPAAETIAIKYTRRS